MMNTDVVVIGAGPAGLIVAREAAKIGAKVTVLEEHKEIGVPCHCAGLLSIKGLKHIAMPLNANFIQNKLKGARFYSPSGLFFTVERKEDVACAVDRTKFDKLLAREAAHTGTEIKLQSKVQQVNSHSKGVTVSGPWGSINADVVIDAEGVNSRLVEKMGLTPLKPECLLPALQFEIADVDLDPAYAEIHVGRKVAPNFFAWVIPLNGNSARVGLACKGANPREKLESFVRSRFDKYSRLSVSSGRIVTCGPIPRTFDDNLIVVGDAAGQAKPTTGGGVILGGICASLAGSVVAEAVKSGTYACVFLRKYEVLWKKRLGKEFRIMRLARKTLNRLSDKTLDKIFKIILDKNFQAEFSMKGDIDFQYNLISALGKKRDLLRILLTAAPDLINFRAGL
jgi:geranylgeranyl reductase family protein